MHFPIPLHSIAVELQKPQANNTDENLSLIDEHQQQKQKKGAKMELGLEPGFTPVLHILSRQSNMKNTGKSRAEVRLA